MILYVSALHTRTLVTQPFHHEIDVSQQEFFRELHRGDRDAFQAECFVATGAVKVNVQFVERALAIVVAHRVLHGAGAIVDAVNEQVCMEQRDGSGDGRFIDCPQHCFQI